MKQDKRSYTFVFAPTSNFPLRKFNVYHKALYAVLGFAIIGLLSFIWLMYEATQYGFVKLQNYNLKRHNRELKEENQRAKVCPSTTRSRWLAIIISSTAS